MPYAAADSAPASRPRRSRSWSRHWAAGPVPGLPGAGNYGLTVFKGRPGTLISTGGCGGPAWTYTGLRAAE
jgi:hypothetical protein